MFAQKLLLFLLAILIPTMVAADLNASTEQTMAAEAILAKYVEVIGGKTAFEKINSKITETTMTVTGKRTEIKTTTFMERPNKVYSTSEFKILGKTITAEAGTNGEVVWEVSPRKDRILTGIEKERRLTDWAFDGAIITWKQYYKDIKAEGFGDVNGKQCYKVIFKPINGGADVICYFDKDSYLLSKVVKEVINDDKTATAELYFSDYKKIDNLLIPHTVKRFSKGSDEVVITVNTIKSNVDIPDAKFELPEKIKDISKAQG
jgi:hypothetical protein